MTLGATTQGPPTQPPPGSREPVGRAPAAHFWAVLAATARLMVKRNDAYKVEVVRGPLSVLVLFGVWRLTYAVAGRQDVDGADAAGFLFVGTFGVITWSTTVWSMGYALVRERGEGTLGTLFLAPASRGALILGYGCGQFALMARILVVLLALAAATGARLHVADVVALGAGVLALPLASLATGFAFSGLFILSRRGNQLANFLQMPIWLLAGFMVPRSELHPWLQGLSHVVPASHAVEALRAAALRAASLAAVAPDLAIVLGTSVLWAIVGAIALRRVERAARRAGTLGLG